jgi:SAM-dependent methyltransferase
MCNANVLEFFIEEIGEDEFKGKRVLEIGSRYVNGSVRPFIERFLRPKNYIGVDIEPGKYVDVVLDVENLVDHFGSESFDVVIAAELLEHVNNWQLVINNIKKVLKPAGYIYITTRSRGFPFHAHPYDFWRFEVEDMKNIFSDLDIICLRKDQEFPGVFLKCRKSLEWNPLDLEGLSLYSMVLGKRATKAPKVTDMPLIRRARLSVLRLGKQLLMFARVLLEPEL